MYHSILDWSRDEFPERERFVEGFLHPQVRELVDRFRPATLWGDGHWGQAAHHWQAQPLMDACRATLADAGVDLMTNDRWGLAEPDFVTYEYDIPDDPPDGPWELCRGISHSFCFNRAEEDDDHLTPHEIVDLLTEVVAKGGNFLLNIGPKSDGTVPDIQASTLRSAGEWVNTHADVIHGSERFDVWGDEQVRYTVTPQPDSDGRRVNIVDLANEMTLTLAHFSPHRYPVHDVNGAVEWHQDERGLHLRRDSDAARPAGGRCTASTSQRYHHAASASRRRSRAGPITIDDESVRNDRRGARRRESRRRRTSGRRPLRSRAVPPPRPVRRHGHRRRRDHRRPRADVRHPGRRADR